MRVITTLIWVVITAALVAFIAMNWHTAAVNFWPTQNGYLHFEWPIGFIALVSYLAGLLPMWLLHRTGRFLMSRKINSLENTVRQQAATPPPPPIATSTQLEAEQPRSPTL